MSKFAEQLQAKVDEHNQLHQSIANAEEQVAAMKAQRERLLGQVQLLQELAQEEAGVNDVPSDVPDDVLPEAPTESE